MRINRHSLKAIREGRGFTISGLSQASGVDRTVVTRLESGERRGTPTQIRALAIALCTAVPAIAIFDIDDDPDTESVA
jgi:transcriptional regulator with XRE-family HTH domain